MGVYLQQASAAACFLFCVSKPFMLIDVESGCSFADRDKKLGEASESSFQS